MADQNVSGSSARPGQEHASTGSQKPGLGDEIRSAAARAEEDLQKLIQYLNDEVVPDVRRHSSSALHSAADALRSLAQKMDDRQR